MYLKCLSHNPPLFSDEVGQHSYDLADIRKYIANRKHMVALIKADIRVAGATNPNWAYTAAWFFYRHQECQLGIENEYGGTYLIGIGDDETEMREK